MKYICLLIISVVTISLFSCGSKQVGPQEFFSETVRIFNDAAIALEDVEDGKHAHQASQKLDAFSEDLADIVLRLKPFDQMSTTEAAVIIDGFDHGRAAMERLVQAVGTVKSNHDYWIVLESSVGKFGKSMEKVAVVMRSYIEALPTQS